MRRLLLFAALVCLANCAPEQAPKLAPVVKEIKIHSLWGGLGPFQETVVVIRNWKGVYFDVNGSTPVGRAKIDALVDALHHAPLDAPTLENVGIDERWLRQRARSAGAENYTLQHGSPKQQAFFLQKFTDIGFMRRKIRETLTSFHTDDNPGVLVTIKFQDGSSVFLCATGQHPYLLPWLVRNKGVAIKTFDARISRAVAALVPQGTTNLERLRGDGLDSELADDAMSEIEDQWNLIDVEDKAGSALALLRAHYSVEAAQIGSYFQTVYGKPWINSRPQETNLHVTLHEPEWPRAFSVELVLEYRNGKVEGVERFLRDAPAYERLALSVPWLAAQLHKEPGSPVRLLYVHDASFGARAQQVFFADMKTINNSRVAAMVRDAGHAVAVVWAGSSYPISLWFILPDSRMILWRYSWKSGLLNLSPRDFRTRECNGDVFHQEPDGGCVGAMLSPDGKISN